ncbi:hypothetical protein [Mesoplasma melaleucae]|uniref:Uncharacterized protein n=1 Tax=Mesoplasma melaleucae TaxID=81459 RepID=A0A2K8NYG4_9MOLU|nr:hypothetical protein [Mesoplasma melaleucae]ATZ17791.1 hypothetical protein EMELA_v1c02180 [Mesoplasma melaleucae]
MNNFQKITFSNKNQLYFCLKYFNFKEMDKTYINNYKKDFKKMLEKIVDLHGSPANEIIITNKLILEKATSCKEKAIAKLGDKVFNEKFNGKIYDFFRGNHPLRVFGVLDSSNNCFYLLEFDPIHTSR